ncbi:MAG: SO_0444 family Cu/Zn efflux transporter [Deltaproteobacteria bacterium]|uniref:SO_0444 family Cu/Zn efflux transporter n=1 Tax=Candidatus Zymogenus saltonus TaxID=2844893 RepID=A0A9D8KDH3_9DELT|nr:SO_0444 family Cu/Zn efflux transporter [Candidatus Zymogenus saltonus]
MIVEMLSGIMKASWWILKEAAPYVLFGSLFAGLIYIFLNPETIYRHFGKGKVRSVLLASIFGIPVPLCSCGVLPAAVSLRKQGATRGATLSFLISTPESGVDSIAVTYALIDPLMTVIRPISAFISATIAGIADNLTSGEEPETDPKKIDITCKVDGCCDGINCPIEIHRSHHTLFEKLTAAVKYSFGELFEDFALWFVIGVVLAGAITYLAPERLMERYLGGGLHSMLIMLLAGIPMYICATASTPIAAALILSGVSPGAALVFLLAGPATNLASLSVVAGTLGKRSAAIYLATISVVAVSMGLLTDRLYSALGVTPGAYAGKASEFIGEPVKAVLAAVSAILLIIAVYNKYARRKGSCDSTCSVEHIHCEGDHDHHHH